MVFSFDDCWVDLQYLMEFNSHVVVRQCGYELELQFGWKMSNDSVGDTFNDVWIYCAIVANDKELGKIWVIKKTNILIHKH